MATQSVHPEAQINAPHVRLPKSQFWKDDDWKERTEVPGKARQHLTIIDRNIYVCMNLASLLVDNDNAVTFASGDEATPIRALPFDQRAAVVLAIKELLAESSDLSDSLRNDGQLWGEGA